MMFRQKFLNVLVSLCLLSCPASTKQASRLSLWGKVVNSNYDCSHWRLKSHISIPALHEFTVCLSLKFKMLDTSSWTAFMYRHPEVQSAELGLGGRWGRLVVWLFGTEWRTPPVTLRLLQWYSLCLTWSHTKDKPSLYVDGNLVDITAAHTIHTSASLCRNLTPNGTLTLGAAHLLNGGHIQILPFTCVLAKLSLFRLWGRERSKQEVTSLNCTEGDLVKWDRDNWETELGTLFLDHSLQCDWSFYEVRLMFAIFRYDSNNTELYTARDIAHRWLREVLPDNIYLHRVSVFDVIRSSAEESLKKTSQEDKLGRWTTPNMKRFHCLVHVNVIPSSDVAAVQNVAHMHLKTPYYPPGGLLQLLADERSIYTTPVESFSTATMRPPDVVTELSPVTTSTCATTAPPSTPSSTTMRKTTTTSTTTRTTAAPMYTSTTTNTSTGKPTTISTSMSTSTGKPTTTSTTTSTSTGKPTTTSITTSTSTGKPTTTSTITSTSTGKPTTTSITTSTTTGKPTTTSTATSTSTGVPTTISTTTIPTGVPTTISTTTILTGVPTTVTTTARPINISDLYFEVKVNVSIKGNCDLQQSLSTWLNSSLPDDMMRVLDLQLLPRALRDYSNLQSNLTASNGVFANKSSRVSCVFQVQVMMSLSDTQEMEKQIRHLLLTPYTNGSVTIETEDVRISRILLLKCNAETHQTRRGLFEWPATSGGENVTQPCPKNPHRHATRHCKLCLCTHWMTPHLEDCSLVVETIPDLDHIEVTVGNAQDVVEMIEGLLSSHSSLSYHELVTVLNKLEHIVNLSVVTPDLGQALINVISDILDSDSHLLPFTNTILNITEAVGDRMVGYEGSSTLVAPAIAISVVDVVPGQFGSLTFGVSSDGAGAKPEIFINSYPLNGTVAYISLPSALQHSFPQRSPNQSQPRVQFQFYGIPMLFKSSQKGQILNSFVVSASVTNATAPIKDLDEDVKVRLHHLIPNTHHKDVQCVYWNFNKNDGQGGWDDHGCRKYNNGTDYTMCLCDHLTHFGVLLDVSRTQVDPADGQILTIITYVGCGVSSLFLGITIVTYTVFEKLRRDYPSQILINLSLALLGLNLVFLVNSWLASWGLYALCVAAASTLHYFLLASFTWMGLEAVHMYFALVKVFNVYVPSYILKFCALGWGLPLTICILVLVVNREAYGSLLYADGQPSSQSVDSSDSFCWLQDDVTYYVSVVAYAVLVFLFNTAVFVVVLIQIRHMRVNSPAGTRSGLMHDLKGVASLTLLLGLTWTVGFFTWGPARVVLLYLFSGLNTLQGLFIFLFHCLMKENVRKQWRIHLCFGRFRLDEYSEWSNSASAGVTAKPRLRNPPRASVPSAHSVKSSSTESTSASSDSSQRDSSCKRPNLGLFMKSLALPRAQRSSSGTGALPPQRDVNLTPGWRNHLLDQRGQR